MKERRPKRVFIMVTYTICPYDNWLVLGDLLEELAKLEFRQMFLASEINRLLDQEPERLPPISKSLEMDLNAIRIEELNKMVDQVNKKRK